MAAHVHDKINANRKHNRQRAIKPIENAHCLFKPETRAVDPVLTDINQDRAEADNSGGDEKTFCRMKEGRFEGAREPVEAEGNHGDVEEEEDYVEDEEEATYSVQAAKSERNCGFC